MKAKGSGIAVFLEKIALIITLLAFLAVTLAGFFVTCQIEIDRPSENIERVLFLPGNVPVNIMALVILLCLVLLVLRQKIEPWMTWAVVGAMVLLVIGGGLYWVNNTHAIPYADSASMMEHARWIVLGDWEPIRSSYYLRTFPFQMGYLKYLELFFRAFGVDMAPIILQNVNVFSVAASNLLVIALGKALFQNRKVTFFTAILTLAFVQPIFLTTFLYGNLPGMFFANLGLFCGILAIKKHWAFYFPAGIALALACILKMNFAIAVIALGIVLVLSAIKGRNWIPALAALAIAALVLFAGSLPQKHYEKRAGVSFGEGTPQTAWLVTGFRESSLCSGWYNSYTTTVLMENGYDQEQTKAQIQKDFQERLSIFLSRPRYAAAFFGKKYISQWQEPTYQSVWSSAAGEHRAAPAPAVESIYSGRAGEVLFAYCTHLVHLIYVGFLLGVLRLIKGSNLPALALPLVLLGAALYHLIFEAKAQYVLVYIPLMLPIAAQGLVNLSAKSKK